MNAAESAAESAAASPPADTFRHVEAGLEVRTPDGWTFHRDDGAEGWCVACFRSPCRCS